MEADPRIRDVAEGGVLTMYLRSGKKKHKRYFWVDPGSCLIMWDKKKRNTPNKVGQLTMVEARPVMRDAQQWFEIFDQNGSGALDSDELAALYKRAMGEKLSKKQLKQAMQEMDTDGSGLISFDEFSRWWHSNGGDLEKHRDLALTVETSEVTLLLVAQDADTKRRWVEGLTAVLREHEQSPSRVNSAEGFGGMDHPHAWFQAQTAKAQDGTKTILLHGIPVMVAVLPQGLEVRKEATGELLALINQRSIHTTRLTRKGLLVYVIEDMCGRPLPEGTLQAFAVDTADAAEMEEQIAFLGAGTAARSPGSGGTGSSALPPPSPGDVIDASESDEEGIMQPEFVGVLPDETTIGIGVDKRGLALIELEGNHVLEFYDLYTIRGWGANDQLLQVVIAASDGVDDSCLTLATDQGPDIVARLKHFANELAAAQQASANEVEDDGGVAVGDNLPAGWETAVSRTTGDTYYVNAKTGESTYERPTLPAEDDIGWTTLPDGWEEHISDEGRKYYYNVVTGESTYDRPEDRKPSVHNNELDQWPLPDGWEVRTSRSDGDVYYANDSTGESSFERPFPSVPPAEGGPFVVDFTEDGELGLALGRTQDLSTEMTQIVVKSNEAVGGADADGGPTTAAHIRPMDILYSVQGDPVSSGGIAPEISEVALRIANAKRPLRLVFIRPASEEDSTSQSEPLPQHSSDAIRPELEPTPESADMDEAWWVKDSVELGPPATPIKPASTPKPAPATSAAGASTPKTPASISSSAAGTGNDSFLLTPSPLAAPVEEEPTEFPDLENGVACTGKDGATALRAHTQDVLSLIVIEPLPHNSATASTLIASGSEDGTIRVWQLDPAGALPANNATLQNHRGPVRTLATFVMQGHRWLVSGGGDKTVRLWKEDGKQWNWQQTLRGHADDVNTVAALKSSSAATNLASGGDDMTVRLWAQSDSTWQCIGMCRSLTLWVTAVQELGDGDQCVFAAADGDGGISVWSFESGAASSGSEVQLKRQGALSGHKETIWALESFRWNGTTKLLASASADRTIQVWHQPRAQTSDDENPAQESEFKSVLKFRGTVVRRSVNALAFIESALDASVYAHTDWDLDTETMVVEKLRLASGGDDGQVTLWGLQYEWQFGMSFWNYSKIATINAEGPASAVHCLSVVDTQIAVGRADGSVTLLPTAVDPAVSDRKPAHKLDIMSAPKLDPRPVPARGNIASLASDDDDDSDNDDDSSPSVPADRASTPPASVGAVTEDAVTSTTPIKLKVASPSARGGSSASATTSSTVKPAVPAKVPDRSSLAGLASTDEDGSDSDEDDAPITPNRTAPVPIRAVPAPAPAPASAPAPATELATPDRASMAGLEDGDDSDWDSDDGEELPMEATRQVAVSISGAEKASASPTSPTPAATPTGVVPGRGSLAALASDSDDSLSSSEDDENTSTAVNAAMAARAARLANLV